MKKPKPPHPRVGSELFDVTLGYVVVEGFMSTGWPYTHVGCPHGAKKKRAILTEALAEFVRAASVQDVMAVSGMSRDFVTTWRKALGVSMFNDGTLEIWKKLATEKLTEENRRKGGRLGGHKSTKE